MDDLLMVEKEGDDEKEWLDVWMGSLKDVEGSSEVHRCMVEEDKTMEIAILDEQDREVDFMTWLVEELREMHVEDKVRNYAEWRMEKYVGKAAASSQPRVAHRM
jgi:hypothetical protein